MFVLHPHAFSMEHIVIIVELTKAYLNTMSYEVNGWTQIPHKVGEREILLIPIGLYILIFLINPPPFWKDISKCVGDIYLIKILHSFQIGVGQIVRVFEYILVLGMYYLRAASHYGQMSRRPLISTNQIARNQEFGLSALHTAC